MMSDLKVMPDTRLHWKAQLHRLAYEKGVITSREAKYFVATIDESAVKAVAGFLNRRRWFRKQSRSEYSPINTWHDTRLNPQLTRKHRKDDIEYTIVSILQNNGPLNSRQIFQNMWLNNAREPTMSLITNCCNVSRHIGGSADTEWRLIS